MATAPPKTKEATMAHEKIEIIFDTDTGKMIVGGQMETQAQKDRTILMLISAIKLVVDYQKPIIQRATVIPPVPMKVTH